MNTTPHSYYDDETRVIMLGLPMLGFAEQQAYSAYAKERIQAFSGGAHKFPLLTRYLRSELNDEFLLARHDIEFDCIAIDRYVQDTGCYFNLLRLINSEGRGRRLIWGEENQLAQKLMEGDLRKTTAKEVLAKTRGAAAAVKAANKKRSDEAVLEVIDGFSTRQIKQFVDVHRAIHAGEKIIAHGADEKTIEMMAKASQTAPAVPTGKAFNEGMHPLMYKRDPR